MTESEPWSYHADGSPVYSLADIVRKRSAATPDAIALAEPGRLTSFAALDRRSSQVARALQAGGVRPGDRVAFIGANGPEFTEVGCAPHELHCDIGLDEKSTPRACCACWSTAR
jgi:non-ribosomal peptide synthetase component F